MEKSDQKKPFQVVKSNGVVLDGAYEGASISINGVCTTVVTFDSNTFKVRCP